jgi:hypothetical protein
MKAVGGIFASAGEAHCVARELRAMGLGEDKVALLLPGVEDQVASVPISAGEQTGVGKVLGGAVGAAAGAAGGLGLGIAAASAVISGVGPVMVTGFLGAALLGVAGASIGAAAGEAVENAIAEGVPEDEWFVYEDALRQDRSVVIALAGDEPSAESIRGLLVRHGAETIDAAREKWWIGLRDAERESYTALGRDFQRDEVFFRLGFQTALQTPTRGKEYDQVLNETAEELQKLKRRCPSSDVEEPFRRGYERGLAYYESLRGKTSR